MTVYIDSKWSGLNESNEKNIADKKVASEIINVWVSFCLNLQILLFIDLLNEEYLRYTELDDRIYNRWF